MNTIHQLEAQLLKGYLFNWFTNVVDPSSRKRQANQQRTNPIEAHDQDQDEGGTNDNDGKDNDDTPLIFFE